MERTIPFILALTGLAMAGFSAFAENGESSPEDVAPVPEIAASEADLEEKSLALELELSRRNGLLATASPEERVASVRAALEELQPQVDALNEGGENLDALYALHGVVEKSVDERFEERAALVSGNETAAEMRRFVLDYELAKLRETNADDPEALRSAMRAWYETNAEELAALEVAIAEQCAEEPATASRMEGDPDPIAQPPSRGAVIDALEASLAANPPPGPAASGDAPSEQEMEAWSESASREHKPILRQLEEANAAVSLDNARQTAEAVPQ